MFSLVANDGVVWGGSGNLKAWGLPGGSKALDQVFEDGLSLLPGYHGVSSLGHTILPL